MALDILGIGSLISGLVQGGANRRLSRQELDAQQRQFGFNSQLDAGRFGIEQDTANRSLQSDAMRKALLSSIGTNMKDASFSRPDGVPTMSMSGGFRPSALGEQGQAASQTMHQQAMRQLMAPPRNTQIRPYQPLQLNT
jgi:hypothetical protein